MELFYLSKNSVHRLSFTCSLHTPLPTQPPHQTMAETRFDVGMTWWAEIICEEYTVGGKVAKPFYLYLEFVPSNYRLVPFNICNSSEGCASAVKRILGKVEGERETATRPSYVLNEDVVLCNTGADQTITMICVARSTTAWQRWHISYKTSSI